jgi:hypothetical protein
MTTSCSNDAYWNCCLSTASKGSSVSVSFSTAPPAKSSAQKAETEVVVAVARRIPVAIRRPAVDGVVVPTAAPIHPVRAVFGIQPKLKNFRPELGRAPILPRSGALNLAVGFNPRLGAIIHSRRVSDD